MARHHKLAHELLPDQRNRPLIGVYIDPHAPTTHRLLERFAELRWKIIDLGAYNNWLPGQVKFAGAILHLLPTHKVARLLLDQHVPAVRMGTFSHPDDHLLPAIIPDHRAAGRLAAEHFAERGFEHLGFVGRNPWGGFQPLYEGFHERGGELGCACHLLMLDEDELHKKVTADRNIIDVQKQAVQDWWRTLPKPLGMLTNGDSAAHRHCQWAGEANLRVPEDIAILGVDNIMLTCEGSIVPLSSIDRGYSAILDAAIDALRRLMAGEQVECTTIQIPPRSVVTRRSTDVLAATNPRVVAALRYMWDHITENLSMEQIARQVGVSRRTLDMAFQRDLGRGINAEFQRRRLEKGRELLLRTDRRIADIAVAVGFSSPKYFAEAFGAAFGTNPKQYRSNAKHEQ